MNIIISSRKVENWLPTLDEEFKAMFHEITHDQRHEMQDTPAVIPFKTGNKGELLVAVEKEHLQQLLKRCLDIQHETKKQDRRQYAI